MADEAVLGFATNIGEVRDQIVSGLADIRSVLESADGGGLNVDLGIDRILGDLAQLREALTRDLAQFKSDIENVARSSGSGASLSIPGISSVQGGAAGIIKQFDQAVREYLSALPEELRSPELIDAVRQMRVEALSGADGAKTQLKELVSGLEQLFAELNINVRNIRERGVLSQVGGLVDDARRNPLPAGTAAPTAVPAFGTGEAITDPAELKAALEQLREATEQRVAAEDHNREEQDAADAKVLDAKLKLAAFLNKEIEEGRAIRDGSTVLRDNPDTGERERYQFPSGVVPGGQEDLPDATAKEASLAQINAAHEQAIVEYQALREREEKIYQDYLTHQDRYVDQQQRVADRQSKIYDDYLTHQERAADQQQRLYDRQSKIYDDYLTRQDQGVLGNNLAGGIAGGTVGKVGNILYDTETSNYYRQLADGGAVQIKSQLELIDAQKRYTDGMKRQSEMIARTQPRSIADAVSGGFFGNSFDSHAGFDPKNAIANLASTTAVLGRYAASGSVIYAVTQAFASGKSAIVDYTTSLVDLNVAMGNNGPASNGFLDNLESVSRLAGANPGDALDAAARGIRAFGDANQESNAQLSEVGTDFATQASQLAVIAEKGLQDASGDLVAIGTAYGLTAQNISQVNDAISSAKKLGGDPSNVSQGLANFAETAHTAGFSLNEAANALSLVIARTDESGSAAAQRLSRVFQTFGSGTNQALLSQLGVDTTATIKDQLEQLAVAYQTAGPAIQAQIRNAFGGSQASRELIPLLTEQARLQQANADSAKNAGEGQAEFNRKMDSLAGTLRKLSGDFKALSVDIARSGLLDIFGIALRTIEPLVHEVDDLVRLFDGLPGPLKTIIALYAEWRALSAVVATDAAQKALGAVTGGRIGAAPRDTSFAASAARDAALRSSLGEEPAAAGQTLYRAEGGLVQSAVKGDFVPTASAMATEADEAGRYFFTNIEDAIKRAQATGGWVVATQASAEEVARTARSTESYPGVDGMNVVDPETARQSKRLSDEEIAAARAQVGETTAATAEKKVADAAAAAEAGAASKGLSFALLKGGTDVGTVLSAVKVEILEAGSGLAGALKISSIKTAAQSLGEQLSTFSKGLGEFLNSTAGLLTAGIIGIQMISEVYGKTNDILKATNQSSDALTAGGTSIDPDALGQRVKDLQTAAQKDREASAGIFGTIINAMTGNTTGFEAGLANKQATTLANLQKQIQTIRSDAAQSTQDAASAIDVTSKDGITNGLKLLADEGRSATTQFNALITALDRVGQSAAGATGRLSPAQGQEMGALVGANVANDVTQEADIRRNSIGSGFKSLWFKQQGTKDADLLGKVDVSKLSSDVQSDVNNFIGAGGNPLDPKDADALRKIVAARIEADMPKGLSQQAKNDLVTGAIRDIQQGLHQITGVEDPQASLAQLLQQGIPKAQEASKETATAASLAGQSGAVSGAQDYLNKLNELKAHEEAQGAKPEDLEAVNVEIANAQLALQSALVSHLQALAQLAEAAISPLDKSGRIAQQVADLQTQLASVTDADQAAGIQARILDAQFQQAQQTEQDADSKHLVGIDPRNAVGQAQAALDNANRDLQFAKDHSATGADLTSKQVAVTNAEVALAESKLKEAQELADAAVPVGDKAGQALQQAQDLLDQAAAIRKADPGAAAALYHQAQEQFLQAALGVAEQNSSRRAERTDPRDALGQAKNALADDEAVLAAYLKYAPGDITDINNTIAKIKKDAEDVAKAGVDLANAKDAAGIDPRSQLESAEEKVREAIRDLSLDEKGTQQYYQDLAALHQAQASYATALLDAQKTADELRIDITDPVAEARVALLNAQEKLATDKATGAAPDVVNADQLAVNTAGNSLDKSVFDQRLQDIQTAQQLGQISDQAYLSYLESEHNRLVAIQNRTRQQQDELNEVDQAIKGVNSQMQAQFNLGDIKVPSIYEVRRAAAQQSAIVDASVTTNNNTVTINGTDIGTVINVLNSILGPGATGSRTASSTRKG